MPRPLRSLLLALALLLTVGAAGCTCRKQSDADRLREATDVPVVHFYLAAKLALDPHATAPEAADARASFQKVLALREGQAPGADDVKTLAVSLWDLRARGQEALAKGKRDVPPPVLASLIVAQDEKPAALAEILDADTEHGVLLVGLTVAKLHPKSPVPVPEPILLYEAWSTDPDRLSLASLGGVVRGFRAYTYGMAGYCDLASHESDLLDGVEVVDAKDVARDLERLVGAKIPVSPADLRDLGRAPRMLGNGALAICRIERDERDKVAAPLRRFLDDADALGAKGPETEVLRGFTECAEGKVDEGRKRLRAAADSMDDEGSKSSVRELVERCGEKTSVLGKAHVARAIASSVVRRLQHAKLLDRLSETGLAKTTRRFGETLTSTVETGKGAIPSMKDVDSLTKQARGWWPF